MSRNTLPIDKVLTWLGQTPPRLAVLAAGLTPAQLSTPRGAGEWSANDVLAHLRACADVWGRCILAIVSENGPTLRAVNPRTWIEQTDYADLAFEPSLQSFSRQRADLLEVLEDLSPEGWLRTATVTGAGIPLRRTVWFYAQWLARHERPHLKQIERIVSVFRV